VRAHRPLPERLEDGFQREEIFRPIVDEQDVDAVVARGALDVHGGLTERGCHASGALTRCSAGGLGGAIAMR